MLLSKLLAQLLREYNLYIVNTPLPALYGMRVPPMKFFSVLDACASFVGFKARGIQLDARTA